MDVVTDLTAQAVASITIIQNICKKDLDLVERQHAQEKFLWELVDKLEKVNTDDATITNRAMQDVLWCSIGVEKSSDFKKCFIMLADELLSWLRENLVSNTSKDIQNHKEGLAKDGTLYCTPYQWRTIIRGILYTKPHSRLALVKALHYMPVQIILCLGGKKLDQSEQRLYQSWGIVATDGLLSEKDQYNYDKWWNSTYKHDSKPRREMAEALLANDLGILNKLNERKVALPFETFFNNELNEICRSRQGRLMDNPNALDFNLPKNELVEPNTEDPLSRAKRMDLHGLCLSGGGIRSATFSLGVLQKLAEKNELSRFDYLSTVSGGGYIGTWLSCWIKRGGSVSKIADRLNVKKSSDPMGEEVRPIRWLRMFSNYLAPNASIMSADSWTMGITWMRNTLINQALLLLLLCTALSAVTDIFYIWQILEERVQNTYDWGWVAGWSVAIHAPGVFIVGIGMKAYDTEHDERNLFKFGRNRALSLFLIIWAVLVAYTVSSWLYNCPYKLDYMGKAVLLLPASGVAFVAMLAIAYIGLYRLCAQRPLEKKLVDVAIFFSSLIAAAAGLFLLASIWELFQRIEDALVSRLISEKWIFIIGPPLILEAISCCVVIRMALMGKLFPDERREWWGRMGAIVHRAMLLWILITYGALVLPGEFTYLKKCASYINIPALFGGWAAIVGFAVKLAYQSKDAKDKPDSTKTMVSDIFVRVAPYLFMVGFLLIGAFVLHYLNVLIKDLTKNILPVMCFYFKVTIILAVITYLFSWRVGVNEFSLHHFYRNRLVRAYLGATRKRTDRDKTVNNFTGFDKNDDIKLSTFVNTIKDNPYYGPYPIINTTLNASVVSELDRQDRKAESFIFSPLYCGFDFSPTRSAAYAKDKVYEYGFRQTSVFAYTQGPMIGTAMAISGAAVSPNMGYHSSPATAFLLTMFNVRLGWWIGNPRLSTYKNSDPTLGVAYLVSDLIGKSDINSRYVCLSDGGHFDNMGLYELIRRRCTHITLVDAEEDKDDAFEGLANAIRRCRIDFGVEITVDTSQITTKNALGLNSVHVTNGTISYPGDKTPSGTITYVKATLTGDETTDIRQYQSKNDLFPQQPTSDQFFTEEQFESYRQLGYLSI
ncbi:patatin-like phospholipase family protein [Mucilaginibacter sp. McL0603]|uniref:patatin-like phospholipase family protein n=1 Tax=Mucilaginibacter sp. McL0603 TaxID=3415670 RepID=UPI003CF40EA9